MSMGMTPEEFWKGDPYLTVVYRKAWDLRKEQINEQLWLQGAYVSEAINAVAHNLTKKRGQKPATYPQKPYNLTPQTEDRKQEKQQQAQKEAIDYFDSLKKRLEQKYGR